MSLPTNHSPRLLIRHVGNMGDLIFFIPPALAALKRTYPTAHITLVTAWGFKQKGWRPTITWNKWYRPQVRRRQQWGQRNQSGFCISLMMTNPHIDQLVHWDDRRLSLDAKICCEEEQCFPTWNPAYYQQQIQSGNYDAVYELDFGLRPDDDPIKRIFEAIELPDQYDSHYQLYLTDKDRAVAAAVMKDFPRPRIVLLEALATTNTRGWDTSKVPELEQRLTKLYGTPPRWFGSRFIPTYQGRPLTLRENVATLTHCDIAIGVLSGPLHLAAAVNVPTLTLYADQPLHRAAPAYFLNQYCTNPQQLHRTLLGPSPTPPTMLKSDTAPTPLTEAEKRQQNYQGWLNPGHQSTKSALAPITVDEILMVVQDMLVPKNTL